MPSTVHELADLNSLLKILEKRDFAIPILQLRQQRQPDLSKILALEMRKLGFEPKSASSNAHTLYTLLLWLHMSTEGGGLG